MKQDLGLNDYFEFKFNKCRKDFRCKFLSTIIDSRFRIRAIVMRKDKIYGQELRRDKESFYNYSIKVVLRNNRDTIRDVKLGLDGHGDRVFKQALSTYLRRELNNFQNKIFKDIKFVDSHKNVLIQLADMVAGAIHRSYYDDVHDKDLYKRIIANKIEDEWEFGR